MKYFTSNDFYMWNVYDLDSGLHFRQGHSGFNIIIKNRVRTEDSLKDSDNYSKMTKEDENKFLIWLFDTIFESAEEIIFEKDL